MLPVNCVSHADYQNFVVTNLHKYYPDPLTRSSLDIIERFGNLDLLPILLWLINIQNSILLHIPEIFLAKLWKAVYIHSMMLRQTNQLLTNIIYFRNNIGCILIT